jgi:hypothetical protein
MWRRGHFQWNHLPTKFHENPPISSKFIGGGHTDTNTLTGDLTRLILFLESTLKSDGTAKMLYGFNRNCYTSSIN